MTQRTAKIIIFASMSALSFTMQKAALASEEAVSLEVATDRGDLRDPRAEEALEKLSFLLGDWNITSTYALADGSLVESKAKMSGRYAMGGFAIETQDVHSFPGGSGNDIFVSTHIYMIHPKTGDVAAIAINTLGNRKFNDGDFIDDDFVVVASGEMYDGNDHIERTRYVNIGDDRFETKSEISDDGGVTWRDGGYDAVYLRAK